MLCSTVTNPQRLRLPSRSQNRGHSRGQLRGCVQTRRRAARFLLCCTRPSPFPCQFSFTPQRLFHPPQRLCSRRRLFSLRPLDSRFSAAAQAAQRETVLLDVRPALGPQLESDRGHRRRPHMPLEPTKLPESSVHAQGVSCNPGETVNR